jgi:hypothetical protein
LCSKPLATFADAAQIWSVNELWQRCATAAARSLCTHRDWRWSRAFKFRSTSLYSRSESYGMKGDSVEKWRRLEINVGRRRERDEDMTVHETRSCFINSEMCVQLCTLRTVCKVHCVCTLCNICRFILTWIICKDPVRTAQ